jgi:hypothetical protein
MAAPAWAEARLALKGALLLARGDARGFSYFDASLDGFWHSFRAGALGFPLYLILVGYPIDGGDAAALSGWHAVAVEIIHYVISWVAFPLIAMPVIDRLGRGSRFLGFMVAYNWCQLPQLMLFAVVALVGASGAVSQDVAIGADLAAAAAALIYEWYVARVALALPGLAAILIVLLDIALATVLTHVSAALY